jgi:catechol 2,3-dioxygenase-like lactoylglutathione lyase family enzyme
MKLNHLAIAVRDLDAALKFYQDALGVHCERIEMVEAEGVTWLDKELLVRGAKPHAMSGFGEEMSQALNRRTRWLVAQGLGVMEQGVFVPANGLLENLRNRELRWAGDKLSKQLGLAYAESGTGEQVSGSVVRSVNLASGRFAVVQKAQEFTLVPWQQQMERFRGKEVSGISTSQGVDWDLSVKRGQSLGI